MLKNMTGHGVSGMLALLAAVATMGCGDDESTGPLTGLQPEVLAVSPDTGNVGTLVAGRGCRVRCHCGGHGAVRGRLDAPRSRAGRSGDRRAER
jgi:hypothetical protein